MHCYIIITLYKVYYRQDEETWYESFAWQTILFNKSRSSRRWRGRVFTRGKGVLTYHTLVERKWWKINHACCVISQDGNYDRWITILATCMVSWYTSRNTPRIHGKFKVTFTRNTFPSVRLSNLTRAYLEL